MRMYRVCALCVLFPLVASGASAQDFPAIKLDTPVDTATLHTWLLSLDPHLIAWAADFARRRHDAQIVSEITPLLQQWSQPMLVGSAEERESHRQVVLALLDTVIQENATVPPDVVESVADQFPAQALILIKRLPRESSQPILLTWAFGKEDRIDDARARAAAMLLAEKPEPEFVGRVAQRAEQNLTIHVVSEAGMGFGSGGQSASCGDSFGMQQAPGWPAAFAYHLHEEETLQDSPEGISIAQIGSHSISAKRVDANGPAGECSTGYPDAAFRHELIASWLGIKPDEMPWTPDESRVIVWTTRAAYERDLGAATEEQRSKMRETFDRLHELNLLEPIPEPRLVVTVQCGMEPCPLDLAHLVFPAPSFLPIP